MKYRNIYLDAKFSQKYNIFLKLPIIHKIRQRENLLIKSVLSDRLNKHRNVLEIGSGTGYFTIWLAELAKHVTALDHSEHMMSQLQRKIGTEHSIKCITKDFIDFKPKSGYDIIFAAGVLDYIDDWEQFIKRCLDYTEKSLILTVIARTPPTWLYKNLGRLVGSKIYTHSLKDLKGLRLSHKANIHKIQLFHQDYTYVLVIDK